MEIIKKICPECGNEFEALNRFQVVCSMACHYARRNKQQHESRERKRQIAQLTQFTLQEQSNRITQLEQELAAANEKLSQKPVSNPDTEEALRCVIADLQDEIKTLMEDKKQVEAQLNEAESENKKLKKELSATLEELKKAQKPVTVHGITLQHCDRLKLDAMKLPCGERKECFQNKLGKPDKCARNPKEDMKDVVEPGEKRKDIGILEDEND